jgi:hypothetical protein
VEPPSLAQSFSSTRLGLPSDLQEGAFLGGSLWRASLLESSEESLAESALSLSLSDGLPALSSDF